MIFLGHVRNGTLQGKSGKQKKLLYFATDPDHYLDLMDP